jgi:phage-related protein
MGLEPTDWKSMPKVGVGVQEIRVHTGREYRIIYLAKREEAVYVLHGFEKKAQKTSRADIVLARQRLHGLLKERRRS